MKTGALREKLILTADDFGKSPEANFNILALIRSGKFDRVSVLINKPLTAQEIEALLQSNIKIDIHLGLPVGVKINKLSYGESAIKRSLLFIIKYLSGRISTTKMESEWQAQVEKFTQIFGKKPDGINSHQHIHFFPPYFRIALRLAEKYDINYVRLGSKQLLQGNTNVFRILSFFQRKNKLLLSAQKTPSSDYLISLDWVPNFNKFLEKLPDGQTEIICHPERKNEFNLIEKKF